MEKIQVKQFCVKCTSGLDINICERCHGCFCRDHLVEHGQNISEEIDRIGKKCHSFDEQFRECKVMDAFNERIKHWESACITKIQDTTKKARVDLDNYFNKPKTQLKESFNKIMDKVTSKRESNDYTEMELKECADQLNRFQELLEQLGTIKIVADDQWQPDIRVVPSESFTEFETTFAAISLDVTVKSDNATLINQEKTTNTNIAVGNNRSSVPVRGCSVDISPSARWQQRGLSVAGGNRKGSRFYQLSHPYGLYVDDDLTTYVADCANHRIMEWKYNSTTGTVVAGGNSQGRRTDQLFFPNDVVVDREQDCLIIADRGNRRVVRWPRRNATSGTTIISDIECIGVTMDESGALYVADRGRHEVKKYRRGNTKGTIVAGGNGKGAGLDQLSSPGYIFVDQNHSVYVSEWDNNRVIKWNEGAKQGIIVAGGNGQGSDCAQLSRPLGIAVDKMGTVYVADNCNHRIVRWLKCDSHGSVIIGRNKNDSSSPELNEPEAISFDRHGSLYVVDRGNSRVQKFNII